MTPPQTQHTHLRNMLKGLKEDKENTHEIIMDPVAALTTVNGIVLDLLTVF